MIAKRFALGLGIAIIFPAMIHFGVGTISPPPKWQNYQTENYYERHERATPEEQKAMETEKTKLEKQRQTEEKSFQKHLFYFAVPFGILAMVVGTYLPRKIIGAGLMFGGIFCATDGYFNYWSELSEALKFSSSLCAFIVLLILGYLRIEKKGT